MRKQLFLAAACVCCLAAPAPVAAKKKGGSKAKPAVELKGPKDAWKNPAAIDKRVFGLGVIFGDPTAAGVRFWVAEQFALQAWVGGSFQFLGFQATVDALYGWRNVVPTKSADVGFEITAGAGASFGTTSSPRCRKDPFRLCKAQSDPTDVFFGIRAPFVFSVHLKKVPLELFVELAPGLRLYPFGGDIDGGLGARYYL